MTLVGFVALDDARRHDVLVSPGGGVSVRETTSVRNREFFGSMGSSEPGPQGFLVEHLPAHTSVGAHFHPVDQFQVFFGSPGSFYKRSPMDAVMLHYADAYSTYGPFGTAEQPCSFFTLRAHGSAFTGYMPGSRDRLVRRGLRQQHVCLEHLCAGVLPEGVRRDELIVSHSDALAASLLSCGPDQQIALDSLTTSGGQYCCVLAGEIVQGGRRFGPRSLGWCDPGAPMPDFRSGPEGARVLVMRFPVPARDPDTEVGRTVPCSDGEVRS